MPTIGLADNGPMNAITYDSPLIGHDSPGSAFGAVSLNDRKYGIRCSYSLANSSIRTPSWAR
ncbi:MAG: hypothetical protein ACI9NC_000395 [Verrucomicrobiales bacterium]|jgi:hypothetical protein